jgi:hypothetical protein
MAKNDDSQWGHKRNWKGTIFFIIVVLYKLFHGGFFVFYLLAPDFWLNAFDFYMEGFELGLEFWIFVITGIILLAQVAILLVAMFMPLFYVKRPIVKGIVFLGNILMAIVEWIMIPAFMLFGSISTIGAILDIVVFLTFAMKPESFFGRTLRPFVLTPKEQPEGSQSPRKDVSTV